MADDIAADAYEIQQVVYRYAHALDSRDWEMFDGCFTPNASIEMSVAGAYPSPAAYREKAKVALAALDVTHHVFTNPRISVDGDRARGHFYYQAQHVRDALAPRSLLMIGGRVELDLIRVQGRWLIEGWRGRALWMDGNPGVLGLDLAPGAVPVTRRAR